MRTSTIYTCLLCSFYGCNIAPVNAQQIIQPKGTTILSRFAAPPRYERSKENISSFAHYLRQLPLKPNGSKVMLYNGLTKNNANIYCGVVAIDIGMQDLQQCADAVMRLRGEYLFAQQQWSRLGFEFTKDQQVHFFVQETPSPTYKNFRNWMNKVFAFANTRSLHHQLRSKAMKDIAIGDVLIQTGNPFGHAVIVVDMACNLRTGDKVLMLAQSYMPAQDIQILLNPNITNYSPWYSLSEVKLKIKTPEWTFTTSDLRSWE